MMTDEQIERHFKQNRRMRLTFLIAVIVYSTMLAIWALHNLEIL